MRSLTSLASPTSLLTATALLALALTPTACLLGPPEDEPEAVDEFRQALPSEAEMEIVVPGAETAEGGLATEGEVGTQAGALVGELSQYYLVTRNYSWNINFHLRLILQPIKDVVDNYPPTVTIGNKAVWKGSGPLDPQEHLLVIKKLADGTYRFVVFAKLKDPADAPWRPRVAGTYDPEEGPESASGSVWVNLDTDYSFARNELDESSVGKVLCLWSRQGGERQVTAYFFMASGDVTQDPPRNAVYHFQREADLSGLFVFGMQGVDADGGKPGKEALEDVLLVSRWTKGGAGRADGWVTGGDVASQGFELGVVTQCWLPSSFKTGYEAVHVKTKSGEVVQASASGDVGTCPYAEPAEPALPDLGEEPADPEVPEEATE